MTPCLHLNLAIERLKTNQIGAWTPRDYYGSWRDKIRKSSAAPSVPRKILLVIPSAPLRPRTTYPLPPDYVLHLKS